MAAEQTLVIEGGEVAVSLTVAVATVRTLPVAIGAGSGPLGLESGDELLLEDGSSIATRALGAPVRLRVAMPFLASTLTTDAGTPLELGG